MNFDNIGQNSLKEASAFKKIRTTSKTYTSNLTIADPSSTTRFKKLHGLYKTDNSFLTSTNYSFLRQHNLVSTKALGGSIKPALDNTSFKKFLELNSLGKFDKITTANFQKNINFLETKVAHNPNTSLLTTMATEVSTVLSPQTFFATYGNLANTINNDSDKTSHHYPLRKLLNTSLFGAKFLNLEILKSKTLLNLETATNLTSTKNTKIDKVLDTSSLKARIYQAPNQVILPSDQNIRQYSNLTPTTTSFNFSDSTFSLSALNLTGHGLYETTKSGWANPKTFLPLLSNKVYLEAPFSPIFSNQPSVDSLNYDTSSTVSEKRLFVNNDLKIVNRVKTSNDIFILRGKRDGAPAFLSSSY
jgi:hypothetical protein